ncbi:acyltransferase family protein [Usitatibacter palustris]|uniref:acyltransferase family protein n=1 Tax=Usitatibacter palustris TaxID=2732487 RepID=UPI001BB123BF|nr:acyltransferase [Usitatibacter palustris]
MRAEVGHIGAIEGLRGVAVLWVVLMHYFVLRGGLDDPWIGLLNTQPALKAIVANGYLGVDLFFLITGFLLTLPWFRHAMQGRAAPSAREFYRRRVRRIVPAYYVQLLILFALVIPLVHGSEFWMRNLWFTLYNIGAHVTFLHYTTPLSSASLSLNGALWTLALEAQYYLLLPLLAPLFVRWPWRTTASLAAIALAWRYQANHGLAALVAWEMRLGEAWKIPESTIRHFLWTQLPGYLAHFAIGVMIGRAWLMRRVVTSYTHAEAAWQAIAVAALVGLYVSHAAGSNLGDFAWAVVPLSLGLAMYAFVVRSPHSSNTVLAQGPLAFVGRVSYSTYLYHLPLLLVWNKYAPDLSWAGFPVYLALLLALSWLSWRFVERPFMQPSSKPVPNPWPTNAAPGASEAPTTSPTTTASGASPSTTTASSSNS